MDKISRVQEGELGVAEFQVAVLTSLLSIMQDQARPPRPSALLAPQSTYCITQNICQEQLNKTLNELTEERMRMKLDQEQAIISNSSDCEENMQSKN